MTHLIEFIVNVIFRPIIMNKCKRKIEILIKNLSTSHYTHNGVPH